MLGEGRWLLVAKWSCFKVHQCHAHALLDMETAERNKVSPILPCKSWSFQKVRKVTFKSYLLVFSMSCSIAKAHSPIPLKQLL